MKTLKVKKLHKKAKIPTRSHEFDAGLDLYALYDQTVMLGATAKIATGIAVDIPEGYYAQVHDRSGMAIKGLRTGAGVIDHGYQGEVAVVLHNLNYCGEDDSYLVREGDRVAQLVLHKIELPKVLEVESFLESERGDKGFNSTGR